MSSEQPGSGRPQPPSDSVAVQPCPLARTHVVEILVVGQDEQPFKDVAVVIVDGERQTSGKTGSDGLVRVEGLEQKTYQLHFPEIDATAIEEKGSRELHRTLLSSRAAPEWSPAAVARTAAAQQNIDPGNIYVFRRLDLPKQLGIRFLAGSGAPRAGEPFLALIETASGGEHPVLEGTIDPDGMLTGFLPADAVRLEVTIGAGADADVYDIDLKDFRAATEVQGLEVRLEALGYYTGDITDTPTGLMAESIAAFQEDFGLPITGEADAATVAAIEKIFLS